MRAHHTRRLLSSVIGLIVLACAWLYLAPSSLGGSTTYVVTHGISMEPRFHTGDLALVRSQSNYHIGEIVAYQNKMLGTVVLHRLIGREGNRYLFKGDNNNFVDFEHPTRSQLIGALWIHIPGVGATLQSIHSPALIGALVALGTLLFTGVTFTRRRHRRQRHRREGEGAPPGAGPSRIGAPRPTATTANVLTIGSLALLPFVVLALLAFTRASSARAPYKLPYQQSIAFSYSAATEPGPTYANDRAVTGEPLFTRVLSTVQLRFAYRFHSSAPHSLAGSASLSATMTSSFGWHTTFPLASRTSFKGSEALLTGTLDVRSLQALMHRIDTTTGVVGSYTLTLNPHVDVFGRVESLPLRTSFAPTIGFMLTEFELQPLAASSTSITGATTPSSSTPKPSAFTPSSSGSVSDQRPQPLYVSIKLARMSVASARELALGGIALIVCLMLAALAFMRPRNHGESAQIRSRYGHLIVPVARMSPLPGVAVIDVNDMEALVRIAEHYDRSILHDSADGGETFWVNDESGQFRYALGTPVPLRAAQPAQEPTTEEWELVREAPAPAVAQPLPVTQDLVEVPASVLATPPVAFATSDPEPATSGLAHEVYADELELGALMGDQSRRVGKPKRVNTSATFLPSGG